MQQESSATLPVSVDEESDAFGTVTRRFLDLVQALPYVEQVIVQQTTSVPHIWTVISAPPFDFAYRQPVYEAQLQALQNATEHPVVDFRLINIQEIERSLDDALPMSYQTLYKRMSDE